MIKTPLVAFNQNETPLCKSCKTKERLVNITTKCIFLIQLQLSNRSTCPSFFNSNQLTYIQYVTGNSQNP